MGVIALDGNPLRLGVLVRGARVEILLHAGRDVERFRIDGRTLVRIGAFRAPLANARPLHLDAASRGPGGDPLVAAVFGEDVRSVDRGATTQLHAFLLVAGADGELRPVSEDLGAWLRLVDGEAYLQPWGAEGAGAGSVHRVEERSGRYAPVPAAVPWAGRSLLEAVPLPGGAEALAWDGERLNVVRLDGGRRVPGGSALVDLGEVLEPSIAVRTDRPMLRGLDKEGRSADAWVPVPRRVLVAGGAAHTVHRQRSGRLFGKPSGQDAIVRAEWSGGMLAVADAYPPVDAFVLDFALIERPGERPMAVLLVNEKEDGTGRAHLVFQRPL